MSIVRSSLACLPVVGPLVSIHNIRDINLQISVARKRVPALFGQMLQTQLAAVVGAPGVALQAQNIRAQARADKDQMIDLNKQCRTFSICALVGDVLTIASLVSFVALEIITGGILPLLFGFFCAGQALIAYMNLRNSNRNLEQLQNLPEQDLVAQPA